VIAAKELQLQDKTYCNNPLAKSFFHCVFSKFISSQINLKKRGSVDSFWHEPIKGFHKLITSLIG
jgi:hypothetical protein